MSKKLADLEKTEKRNIEEQLESISSSMGMDVWEVYTQNGSVILQDLIGICYNCKNLNYCKTEFNSVHAVCTTFETKLSGQNRIVECNVHAPRGVMTLNDMYAIAYLIDPAEEKVEGFISNNPRLKKKKKGILPPP